MDAFEVWTLLFEKHVILDIQTHREQRVVIPHFYNPGQNISDKLVFL